MSALQDAINKGVQWIVSNQSSDGSFGNTARVSTTALMMLKLQSYAIEMGLSPFDNAYIYKNNVVNGLDYIMLNAITDANGVHFDDFYGEYNYTTGIVLTSICAGNEPTRVVNVIGSSVNGQTYKQVADQIVQFLTWSQKALGVNRGGWAYQQGGTPDNSVSGYTTLGLMYAESFGCTIPAIVKTNLDNWISYIQNAQGGSGYTSGNDDANILRTGNLIEQMNFYGDNKNTSVRLKNALTYVADNFNSTDPNIGWNIAPVASYQACFTLMKGLSSYDIDIITTSSSIDIDWFTQMSQVIIAQQNPDGSWPTTSFDVNPPFLSTVWALLTLEKTIIRFAELPFQNNINVFSKEVKYPLQLQANIDVEGEIKIFAYKYGHCENETTPNSLPGKGDDIGFTLIFGNYGEFEYVAQSGKPTVSDRLVVQSPAYLQLMSLSLPTNYRLFNQTDNKVMQINDELLNIEPYIIIVQYWNGVDWIEDFNLPPHSIYSISMLFQIEFPAA